MCAEAPVEYRKGAIETVRINHAVWLWRRKKKKNKQEVFVSLSENPSCRLCFLWNFPMITEKQKGKKSGHSIAYDDRKNIAWLPWEGPNFLVPSFWYANPDCEAKWRETTGGWFPQVLLLVLPNQPTWYAKTKWSKGPERKKIRTAKCVTDVTKIMNAVWSERTFGWGWWSEDVNDFWFLFVLLVLLVGEVKRFRSWFLSSCTCCRRTRWWTSTCCTVRSIVNYAMRCIVWYGMYYTPYRR